jgi:hypothetical protein
VTRTDAATAARPTARQEAAGSPQALLLLGTLHPDIVEATLSRAALHPAWKVAVLTLAVGYAWIVAALWAGVRHG